MMVFTLFVVPRDSVVYDLVMQIFAGLVLAIAVFWISEYLKEESRKENTKEKLKRDHHKLVVNLKRLFRRQNSPWNFGNMGPSFYLDGGKIYQIYEFLTKNNRFWEIRLIEYGEEIKKDRMVHIVRKFVRLVEETLVTTEKMDTVIKKHLNASLSGEVEASGADNKEWPRQKNEYFTRYFVFRSMISGLPEMDSDYSTKILFGWTEHSNLPVRKKDIDVAISYFKDNPDKFDQELFNLKSIYQQNRKTIDRLVDRLKECVKVG